MPGCHPRRSLARRLPSPLPAAALAGAILLATAACSGAVGPGRAPGAGTGASAPAATGAGPTSAGFASTAAPLGTRGTAASPRRPVALTQTAGAIGPGTLTWSPAGDWLAYATADGHLWLHDGRQGRPLGVDLGAPGHAVLRWSPTGDAILAGGAWTADGEHHTALWLVGISAKGPGEPLAVVPASQVLSPAAGNTGAVGDADWSPGGDAFVFAYRGEAWRGSRDGGVAARLTHLAEDPVPRGHGAPFDAVAEVAWSPEGSPVALGLTCGCPSPWGGVAVVDPDGGAVDLLIDGGLDIAWSPDGRVVFTNSLAEWSPTATVDRYTVDPDTGETVNLTRSNPDWDPLVQGGGGPPSPVQSGRLVWGPDGLYLHEVFARPEAEAPLPLRGYVVRTAAGDVAESHPGTGDAWFVAAAWVDGQPAHIEAAPGPPPLAYRRAVIGQGPALDLDLKATAAAWAKDGERLALVQRGPDGADEVVVRTVGGDQPSSSP